MSNPTEGSCSPKRPVCSTKLPWEPIAWDGYFVPGAIISALQLVSLRHPARCGLLATVPSNNQDQYPHNRAPRSWSEHLLEILRHTAIDRGFAALQLRLSGVPFSCSARRSVATKLGMKNSTVSSFSIEVHLVPLPKFVISKRHLWVRNTLSRTVRPTVTSWLKADVWTLKVRSSPESRRHLTPSHTGIMWFSPDLVDGSKRSV